MENPEERELFFLFNSIRDYINNIKKCINKTFNYEYPSKHPYKLAELLLQIIQHMEENFITKIQQYTRKIELGNLYNYLSFSSIAFEILGLFIKFFELSKLYLVKREIYFILKETVELLDLKKLSPFFTLQDSHNFEIVPIIKELEEKIIVPCNLDLDKIPMLKEKKDTENLLVMFTLPITERENPLLLCILYHEFGHLITNVKEITKEITDIVEFPEFKKFKEIIEKGIQNLNTDKKLLDKIIPERYGELKKIFEKWINEICADIIAVKISGPCFYFAYLDLLLKIPERRKGIYLDRPTDHPPDEYRIKYIETELRNSGFNFKNHNTINNYIEVAKGIISRRDVDPIEKTIEEILFCLIDSVYDKLKQKIDKEIGEISLKYSDSFGKLIKNHLEYLDKRIPIAYDQEGKNPAEIRLILNSSWYYYLLNFKKAINEYIEERKKSGKDTTEEEAFYDLKQALDDLIYKSIELTYIWKQYKRIAENSK